MGSDCSKSTSTSAQSSDAPQSANATDRETLIHLRDEDFTRVAVIARNLEGRAGKETVRITAEVCTLGAAAITRGTIGNLEHWAFVARTTEQGLWYVVHFNGGNVIGNNWSGKVFNSWNAVEIEIQGPGDREEVWFVHEWKNLSALSLADLNAGAKEYPDKVYSLTNNCQFYAQWVFDNADGFRGKGSGVLAAFDEEFNKKVEAADAKAREEEAKENKRLKEDLEKSLEEDRKRKIAQAVQDEQARAFRQKKKEWDDLNRAYRIPGYLQSYITKVLSDQVLDAQQQQCINVGVLGNSGTGKSSLLRLVLSKFPTPTDQRLPESCAEGDGTRVPTPYQIFPENPRKIHLWDIPGQGTSMFKAKTYLRDMGLKYFDVIFVATDGRWKENDENLVSAINDAGIRCMVVRTKVDQAVEDCFYDRGMAQDEALEHVFSTLSKHLQGKLPTGSLHLVTTEPNLSFGSVDPLCKQVRELWESE